MSTVIIEQDFPFDIIRRGERDSSRHHKRVKNATRQQLKDIIAQNDILTSDGNKKVKVKLRGLEQYRFIRNRDYRDYIGRDEFDELNENEILQRPQPGSGDPSEASEDPGEELYEVEYSLEELTKIMMEELKLPDLDETLKAELISESIEFNDRRREHGIEACLDKRKTLLANLLRKKKLKLPPNHKLPIVKSDKRFKTYDIIKEKHSNAVIFLMMDRSGSMTSDRIYAVKALYFWLVQFLKRKYDKIEIRLIAHDTIAKELKEKEFFTIKDSGGTKISAAYELCKEIIQKQYSASLWNIYVFHATDGDTFGDENVCVSLVKDLLNYGIKLFSYSEIRIDERYAQNKSEIYNQLETLSNFDKRVITYSIDALNEVYKALKTILNRSREVHK